MQPMKRIDAKPATLNQLKTRAENYGMTIRKHERGEDSYMLVDVQTNLVVAPYPLTLEEIEEKLDGLDKGEISIEPVKSIEE